MIPFVVLYVIVVVQITVLTAVVTCLVLDGQWILAFVFAVAAWVFVPATLPVYVFLLFGT